MAFTARTAQSVEDDVSMAIYGVLKASAPSNGQTVIARAVLDGNAMVWNVVQDPAYSTATDVSSEKHRHLWISASLYFAKKVLHGTAAGQAALGQFLEELKLARVYLTTPERR